MSGTTSLAPISCVILSFYILHMEGPAVSRMLEMIMLLCRVQTAANTPKGGGQGDPIFTGFDGRVFEFLGNPESFYNIVSERHHQVLQISPTASSPRAANAAPVTWPPQSMYSLNTHVVPSVKTSDSG